jgi:hypothetical protein
MATCKVGKIKGGKIRKGGEGEITVSAIASQTALTKF